MADKLMSYSEALKEVRGAVHQYKAFVRLEEALETATSAEKELSSMARRQTSLGEEVRKEEVALDAVKAAASKWRAATKTNHEKIIEGNKEKQDVVSGLLKTARIDHKVKMDEMILKHGLLQRKFEQEIKEKTAEVKGLDENLGTLRLKLKGIKDKVEAL